MEETGEGTQLMENILIEQVIQEKAGVSSTQDANRGKPRNTMLGLNENNKFSNVTFKNCYYDGKWLGSFEDGDFLVNKFRENIVFIADSIQHEISLSVNEETGGSVLGGGSFSRGETITVSAKSDSGYVFVDWSLNGNMVSTDPQYTFTILEDKHLTATFSKLTSSEKGLKSTVKIYPNPANDMLYLKISDQKIKEIVLIDLTGKIVFKKTNIYQNESIDLSKFESGFYIFQIRTFDKIFTEKIRIL